MNNHNDTRALNMYVKLREDYQDMRKRVDNRLGLKADGEQQNVERAFTLDQLERFQGYSGNSRDMEKQLERDLAKELKKFPIYNEFLKNVKGCGDIAAAHIIGKIDIYEATTVSKIWQYAGMNPGMVRGKKRRENKDGTFDIIVTDEMVRGDKMSKGFVAPFNKPLRTALLGVMADCMIKAGIRGQDVTQEEYDRLPEAYRRMKDKQPQKVSPITPQAEIYLNGKHRYQTDPAWKEKTPAHRHRAAIRVMVKQFLADLYAEWRKLEGLPVRESYNESRRGFSHAA